MHEGRDHIPIVKPVCTVAWFSLAELSIPEHRNPDTEEVD